MLPLYWLLFFLCFSSPRLPHQASFYCTVVEEMLLQLLEANRIFQSPPTNLGLLGLNTEVSELQIEGQIRPATYCCTAPQTKNGFYISK